MNYARSFPINVRNPYHGTVQFVSFIFFFISKVTPIMESSTYGLRRYRETFSLRRILFAGRWCRRSAEIFPNVSATVFAVGILTAPPRSCKLCRRRNVRGIRPNSVVIRSRSAYRNTPRRPRVRQNSTLLVVLVSDE